MHDHEGTHVYVCVCMCLCSRAWQYLMSGHRQLTCALSSPSHYMTHASLVTLYLDAVTLLYLARWIHVCVCVCVQVPGTRWSVYGVTRG